VPDLAYAPGPATGALTYKPIPPKRLDALIVRNGYDAQSSSKWGDPVLPGAPEFDLATRPRRTRPAVP
jgi:secreted PhoX family phosphatase